MDPALEPGAGSRSGDDLRGPGGVRRRRPAAPRAGRRRRRALYPPARRHQTRRQRPRPRSHGQALRAAVRLLRGRSRRLRCARRRFRGHRGGHRHRAHGARLRRGRSAPVHRGGDRRRGARRRPGALHGGGRRLGRRERVRRQPGNHRRAEAAGAHRPPRQPRAQLPALLAHRHAGDLPRRQLLVRARDRHPGPDGGVEPADQLDPGARPRRAVRQLAGGRPRLVDQPQPLLGLAGPGVALGRSGLAAHSTSTGASTRSSATSGCAPTTCTGRSWTP